MKHLSLHRFCNPKVQRYIPVMGRDVVCKAESEHKEDILTPTQLNKRPTLPGTGKSETEGKASSQIEPYINMDSLVKKRQILGHRDWANKHNGGSRNISDDLTVGQLVDYLRETEEYTGEIVKRLSPMVQEAWDDRMVCQDIVDGLKDAALSCQNMCQYLSILETVAAHRLNYVRQTNSDGKGKARKVVDANTVFATKDGKRFKMGVDGILEPLE